MAVRHERAKWVVELIKERPWLAGKFTAIVTLASQHFGVSSRQAEHAVAIAYKTLNLGRTSSKVGRFRGNPTTTHSERELG